MIHIPFSPRAIRQPHAPARYARLTILPDIRQILMDNWIRDIRQIVTDNCIRDMLQEDGGDHLLSDRDDALAYALAFRYAPAHGHPDAATGQPHRPAG